MTGKIKKRGRCRGDHRSADARGRARRRKSRRRRRRRRRRRKRKKDEGSSAAPPEDHEAIDDVQTCRPCLPSFSYRVSFGVDPDWFGRAFYRVVFVFVYRVSSPSPLLWTRQIHLAAMEGRGGGGKGVGGVELVPSRPE